MWKRIRHWLVGDKLCQLESENRDLKAHLLRLSGYLEPQIETLSKNMPVDTLKEISVTRIMPHKRAMSWPQWRRAMEANLEEQKRRSRVAGKNPQDTV